MSDKKQVKKRILPSWDSQESVTTTPEKTVKMEEETSPSKSSSPRKNNTNW
jgi:hypothetical protein